MSQRTERVDELLRQEIGAIVRREVADPRIGFATITVVETTPDLRHAKVWVSVIGQPAERDAAIAALRHAMPFVRHELGRRLRIKRIPELHVQLDDTAERGTRILQLLAELETGTRPGPGSAPSPSRCRRRCRASTSADDLAEEPPSAVRPPVAGRVRARAGARLAPATPAQGRVDRARPAMTVDLDARTLDAVPQAGRRPACAARGACWRSATRTPTPTRSARRSASSGSSRRSAARADAGLHRPGAAAVRLHRRRSSGSGPIPDPAAAVRPRS